jgi:hypothetical protein
MREPVCWFPVNGLCARETAEAVASARSHANTPLKRGVNEMNFPHSKNSVAPFPDIESNHALTPGAKILKSGSAQIISNYADC